MQTFVGGLFKSLSPLILISAAISVGFFNGLGIGVENLPDLGDSPRTAYFIIIQTWQDFSLEIYIFALSIILIYILLFDIFDTINITIKFLIYIYLTFLFFISNNLFYIIIISKYYIKCKIKNIKLDKKYLKSLKNKMLISKKNLHAEKLEIGKNISLGKRSKKIIIAILLLLVSINIYYKFHEYGRKHLTKYENIDKNKPEHIFTILEDFIKKNTGEFSTVLEKILNLILRKNITIKEKKLLFTITNKYKNEFYCKKDFYVFISRTATHIIALPYKGVVERSKAQRFVLISNNVRKVEYFTFKEMQAVLKESKKVPGACSPKKKLPTKPPVVNSKYGLTINNSFNVRSRCDSRTAPLACRNKEVVQALQENVAGLRQDLRTQTRALKELVELSRRRLDQADTAGKRTREHRQQQRLRQQRSAKNQKRRDEMIAALLAEILHGVSRQPTPLIIGMTKPTGPKNQSRQVELLLRLLEDNRKARTHLSENREHLMSIFGALQPLEQRRHSINRYSRLICGCEKTGQSAGQSIVRFQTVGASLKPKDMKKALEGLLNNEGNERPNYYIVIGTTDKVGTMVENQVISQSRVQTVADYMDAEGKASIRKHLLPLGEEYSAQGPPNNPAQRMVIVRGCRHKRPLKACKPRATLQKWINEAQRPSQPRFWRGRR